MNKMQKGFTLVELIIVIAVIGILAGTVIVNVGGVREGARSSAARGTMSQLRTQIENAEYDSANNTYITTANWPGSNQETVTLWNDLTDNAVEGQAHYTGKGNPAEWALAARLVNTEGSDNVRDIYCLDSSGVNEWTGVDGDPASLLTGTSCSTITAP